MTLQGTRPQVLHETRNEVAAWSAMEVAIPTIKHLTKKSWVALWDTAGRPGLAPSHHSSLHSTHTSPTIATNREQTYLAVKMWTPISTKKSVAEWWSTFLMFLNEKFRYEDLWNPCMGQCCCVTYTTSWKVPLLYPMNKMKFYVLTNNTYLWKVHQEN